MIWILKYVFKIFLTKWGYDLQALEEITSLETKRIDIPYLGGMLSLDENHYSGIVDYEIELEDQNLQDAQSKLRALLESLNIPFIPNKVTKTARALMAINK